MLQSAPKVTDGLGSEDEQFDALFRQYARKLTLVARSRNIPVADCDDLVQEAFKKALTGFQAGALRDPEKLAAWLHGTFRNLVADYWRTKQCHDRLLPLAEPESLETALAPHVDPDVVHLVRQTLIKLSHKHRLVLILNLRQELTIHEIAPILGRSPGRVGAILAEAKRKFRQHYAQTEENVRLGRLKE